MHQSKIGKHIQALSPKSRERFRLFANSPYFNQHEKTASLLDLFLKHIDTKPKALEKDAAFSKLFPGKAYDEQQMHNLMSYLKKLYLRFMAFEHLEQKRYFEQVFAIEAAYADHQFDILTNRGKQMQKKLQEDEVHDSEFFFASYRLNHALGYYSGHYFDRSQTETFQQMLDDLDKYYLVEKLSNCCHLTANSIMMNTSYDFRFLEELLQHVEKNWEAFEHERAIVLYYTILMSLRDEDNPVHYQRLKQMLAEEMESLSKNEGRALYSFSYNYCIRRINAGHREYQLELFDLYRQGLRQGLVLEKGMISEWDYKNIATLGAYLHEFEWTEQFLNDYREKLPPHRQENAYNFNMGNLYYHKKQYSEALSALLLVQFTDVKYHLSTNFLILRTYYEMRDTEALLSLIETFRIYVIRNRKITTEEKRGYTNFLRFARRLVLLKHHASTYTRRELEEELGKLAGKIEQTQTVMNRSWLLEECQVAQPA